MQQQIIAKVKQTWSKPGIEVVLMKHAEATHFGIPPDGLLTRSIARSS